MTSHRGEETVAGGQEYTKEEIGEQLDAFSVEHGLQSLRDRLNIGLNEVGVLAFERTQKMIRALCEKMTTTPEQAEQVYADLVGMCLDVQTAGPWDYAQELNDPKNVLSQLWHIVTYAIIREYKKSDSKTLVYGGSKEMNGKEFMSDVDRLCGNLTEAVGNPEQFFQEARRDILAGVDKFGIRLESFEEKEKKSGRGEAKMVPVKILRGEEVKRQEWDNRAFVALADDMGGFLTMATKGAEIGITKDHDGWVYVGARGAIDDRLIESCGLTKEVREETDRRGSKRKLAYFKNADGQDVVKKIHPGFLVILTRNFDVAKSIAQAVAHHKETVDIAQESLGHTRVIQTSEAKEIKNESEEIDESARRAFLRPALESVASSGTSSETALVSQKKLFYQRLWEIRGKFVYLDAVEKLRAARRAKGEELGQLDMDDLAHSISEKMWQKVEEVEYINELLDRYLDALPLESRRVIDMAGGAGDVGLAVATELILHGHDIDRVDIVDPQSGTDDFMKTIIANLPPYLRTTFEKIAHHALESGSGYLQDTKITADSIVVAKHACGTLTDDIIAQFKDSDSKLLVAMTCCQDKACGHPSRYGFSQGEWDRLTVETGWTNLEDQIARSSGHKRTQLEEKLAKGKEAMKTMDMARVEYLRRHGFAAELHMTDKFPKGDVIVARRLPDSFMAIFAELEKLEKSDPVQFDTTMLQLDKLSRGGDVAGQRALFGAEWTNDDFAELTRRFSSADPARTNDAALVGLGPTEKQLSLQEQKEIDVFGMRLAQYLKSKGVSDGKPFGQALGLAKKRMGELMNASPEQVLGAIDEIIKIYK